MNEAERGTVLGRTSVIVPCWGSLSRLSRCLSALVRHTRPDWELIAVRRPSGTDGGEGIAAYLAGLRDGMPGRVRLVTATSDLGVRAAWHRGLRDGRGEFLALVHPGTVVTDGWLDQLLGFLRSRPSLGLVGPMTDLPGIGRQTVPGTTPVDLETFAARWRATHRGQWFLTDDLWPGCVVARRSVLEATPQRRGVRVEGLRRRRLGARARRLGFEVGVAHDLFVTQTRRDRSATDGTADQDPADVSSGSGATRPRVSLTMIVKNEEENLPACLESVRGLFDEVVVVDTGSSDRTVAIAEAFGAVVGHFAWIDDFAAARNAALDLATGDHVFWLDADDVLDPPERVRLAKLLANLDGSQAAYVVRCACEAEAGQSPTVVDHVRLFPRRPEIRWEYRVHEQILPALRRANVDVRWTDIVVRHTGYVDPATRARKLERDTRILEASLQANPDDPFLLFNLGFIAVERDQPAMALPYLRKSLAHSAATDSITRKLFALIARCHQALGDPGSALQACASGLALDPEDAELWFRRGILHHQCGALGEAETCWRRLLTLRRPERFSSVDQGIYGHITRRNLAQLVEARGQRTEAAELWRQVLEECPQDLQASQALERLGVVTGTNAAGPVRIF